MRSEAKTVHKKMLLLASKESKFVFELASVLSCVRHNRYWEDIGCVSFAEYCDRYAGVTVRMAQYYIRTHEVFSRLRPDKKLMMPITKMALLSSLEGYLTRRNVNDVLRDAQDMTANQVKEYVRAKVGEGVVPFGPGSRWTILDDGDSLSSTVTACVTHDQNVAIESGIAKMMARGARTRGEALAWCVESALARFKIGGV